MILYMPIKKTWLLRLTEIRKELAALDVPVIDRAMFEGIFGVRRRRAIQLMHFFSGWQAGRTFLVDRLELLRQLEPLEASSEFVIEHRRRQRLVESLEKVRRSRAGARVTIPVEADVDLMGTVLPKGVQLKAGDLRITFEGVADLLAKLYAISQAAAADFEHFRRAAEEANSNRDPGSSAACQSSIESSAEATGIAGSGPAHVHG
jgi:hypothetical protein